MGSSLTPAAVCLEKACQNSAEFCTRAQPGRLPQSFYRHTAAGVFARLLEASHMSLNVQVAYKNPGCIVKVRDPITPQTQP